MNVELDAFLCGSGFLLPIGHLLVKLFVWHVVLINVDFPSAD